MIDILSSYDLQQDSDIEWKKGRTTLIRNMHRTTASPPPINLITTWALYLYQIYRRKEYLKDDTYNRMIFSLTSQYLYFLMYRSLFVYRPAEEEGQIQENEDRDSQENWKSFSLSWR